jgi:DNA-binding LacI/PurR family transcriptional regulator
MKRRPTISDVAKEANVSVASVSLFLNGKAGLSEATRDRIRHTIERLDYVPRGQNTYRPESDLLGLIVERLPTTAFTDIFYGEIVQSMEAEAQALGYKLTLILVEEGYQSSAETMKRLEDMAGVIILGAGDITADTISAVVKEGCPHIFVDTHLRSQTVNAVLVDNVTGAYQATNHLIEKGYRRIACIRGPGKYPSLTERFQGYCFALIEAGIDIDHNLILPTMSHGTTMKGFLETRTLLERNAPFDAIFCVSDRTAFGALEALREAGISVPDSVAVVGFDDVADAQFSNPPLTTVKVPRSLMGQIALQQLHRFITEPDNAAPYKILVYPSLIIRDSVR